MSTHSPKQALFAQFAAIAKTLGHAHRLELLEQLGQAERSVEVLAQKAGLSIANASQHLQHLRRAGLVTTRRGGKFIYYRLADDAVLDLLAALGGIAERNVAEVQQVMRRYFHDRDSLEPISRSELRKRLRSGAVTVLDVRPEDEFALGHLPTACQHPAQGRLRRGSRELDPSQEIVAYCRGALLRAVLRGRSRATRARLQGSPTQDGFRSGARPGCPLQADMMDHARRRACKWKFNRH